MSGWLILSALVACTGEPVECSESSKIQAYVDEDRDGYGDSSQGKLVCALDATLASVGGDCDDTRSTVNPIALEECDGLDNDCDEKVDEDLRELEYYEDRDGDGFGDINSTTMACTPPPGYVENPADCHDDDALSNPAATEFCDDGRDNDCDGLADDADPSTDLGTMPFWYVDGDADGYGNPEKFVQLCVAPAKTVGNPDDCDDKNANIHPAAGEICDEIDNDCDGHLDDSDADIDPASLTTYYADYDADGYGDANVSVAACDAPWFFVEDGTDCNDAEPTLQDASTGWWVIDADGDNFGELGGATTGPSCTPPSPDHVLEIYATDCDDTNALNYPGANEVCDTVDNDCDTLTDDADDSVDLATGTTFFTDADADGFGDADAEVLACALPSGASADDTDCDDALGDVNPDAVEVCNGYDDNCDGLTDEADPGLDISTIRSWYLDYDHDGYGDPTISIISCSPPAGYVDNGDDCDDNVVNGQYFTTWTQDLDGDGYGAGPAVGPTCTSPGSDWVHEDNGVDCDDLAIAVHPGAEEICEDGIDQDCDTVDDSCQSDLADTCGEALAQTPYTTGEYTLQGDFTGYVNDISWAPNNICTMGSTSGSDGLVPVTLQPGEVLRASYVNTLDATMYLLADCNVPNPKTCAAGADFVGLGMAENVFYQNADIAPVTLMLGLDCDGACGTYELDLVIGDALAAAMTDTCTDAQGADALTTGGYAFAGTVLPTMGNDIPDPSNCTGYAANGNEFLIPVELKSGESISADYQQITWDSVIYLLRDCTAVNTCVDGEDNGGVESIFHVNASPDTERYYLGFDCYTGNCDDFEATVVIK